MRLILLALLLAVPLAHAQFDLQDSHSTASLRGIDSLAGGVAWASGSGGTVLHTVDGGTTWKPCATPQGAEKLDFRGVQATDAQTAVIMSSGTGRLSRIYRTTDGCQTWKLVFANPDAKGFFDALHKVTDTQMYLMGDPVGGKFTVFFSHDAGATWFVTDDPGLDAAKGEGAFAASNSGFVHIANILYFGTGGGTAAHVFNTFGNCAAGTAGNCPLAWAKHDVPLATGSAGAGVFSLAGRVSMSMSGKLSPMLVAVGGDYEKPDVATGSAAISRDGGKTWAAALTSPAGYRSAVVFDRTTQSWLATGPTGTDISFDDGKHWKPVAGETAAGWNALSLPFAVGSKGKIGKIHPEILKP